MTIYSVQQWQRGIVRPRRRSLRMEQSIRQRQSCEGKSGPEDQALPPLSGEQDSKNRRFRREDCCDRSKFLLWSQRYFCSRDKGGALQFPRTSLGLRLHCRSWGSDAKSCSGFQPHSSRATLSSRDMGHESAIFCLESGLYSHSNSGMYFLISAANSLAEKLTPATL